MTEKELKRLHRYCKKLEKLKERVDAKIKETKESLDKAAVELLDEENTNEIKNPLFTIQRTESEEKKINLKEVIKNLEAKQFLFNYIEEGNSITIGAQKTFEKKYNEKNLKTKFDDLCDIKTKVKITIDVRPDVPVEDKMSI